MALGHWLKDYIGPHSGGSGGSGGGTGPLIVKKNGDALDHTWQEIVDAPMAWLETSSFSPGKPRITRVPLSTTIDDEGTEYSVSFGDMDSKITYKTSSPNGYPIEDIG